MVKYHIHIHHLACDSKDLNYDFASSPKFLGNLILNLMYRFPLYLVPGIGIPSPTTYFNA